MPDPKEQATAQLRNIEEATGRTVADFASVVADAGLEKHGQIVAMFKSEHGMTHGNANRLAHAVRDLMAGGPASSEALLDAQYARGKAALRPVFEQVAELARNCGEDVEMVVQKTGVSFRRAKQFALVQAPSTKRVKLGLNLGSTPPAGRLVAETGMCSHRIDLVAVDDVDDEVVGWLQAAYDHAG